MPEVDVASEPQKPLTAEMPEGLKNLFDRVMPVDAPKADAEGVPLTPPAKPPDSPPPAAKPEEKKPEPTKEADPIRARLAPDFAAPELVPTAPESAPPPEVEITDEMIAGAKTEKARTDLRKFRDALNHYKEENKTLKSRPAVTEDVESKAALAKVQEENAQMAERLGRLDLMQQPKFQRDHIIPREKKFGEALEIVKNAGGDPDKLRRAIAMSGSARVEALEEIYDDIPHQMLKEQFRDLIKEVDSKTKQINEMVANSKTTGEELTRQEKIDQQQALEKATSQMKTLLASSRRNFAENLKLEVFQKVGKPDYRWWDDLIDEGDALAEEILLRSTPEKAADAANLAGRFGMVLSMYRSERAARLATDKENAELKGADPSLTRDRSQTKNTVPDDADINDAILSRLRAGK